jgi:hypothetical protein
MVLARASDSVTIIAVNIEDHPFHRQTLFGLLNKESVSDDTPTGHVDLGQKFLLFPRHPQGPTFERDFIQFMAS